MKILKTKPHPNEIKKLIFVLLLLVCVILSGCATPQPTPIIKTEYKEVLIPIKCKVQIPQKPKFDPTKPQTATLLAKYYENIEALFLECVSE